MGVLTICVCSSAACFISLLNCTAECQGKVEVTNRIIKHVMGQLLLGAQENAAHWTAYAVAALVLINKQPKARKGLWSAPSLIAGGVMDPPDLLLGEHVGTPAVLSLPVLADNAAFVQAARIKVL
jgi:hypothetical protein